jgi:plastocyanin
MKASMLMAALVFAPISAAAQDDNVEVQLSNYKFTPSTIQLSGGEPVVLHLVNTSGSKHTFHAAEFFAAARRVSGPVRNGDVMVAAHATADIRVTPEPGSYHVHCDRPFHSMLGMSGQILVS